ncbi:hypothetical protein HN935_02100 [archaeon]|jgi:acyl carrier protein|nr:hypothetical protein [archaeon]
MADTDADRREKITSGVYRVLIDRDYVNSREDTTFDIDSLDEVAFIMDIEAAFGIDIHDEDVGKLLGNPSYDVTAPASRGKTNVSVDSVVDTLDNEYEVFR